MVARDRTKQLDYRVLHYTHLNTQSAYTQAIANAHQRDKLAKSASQII